MAKHRLSVGKRILRLRLSVCGQDEVFIIRRGDTTIGTLHDNNLIFAVPTLSRRHAVLHYDGQRLEIEDLASKNGTFVNGQRISATTLNAGDVVILGELSGLIEEVDAEDAALAIDLVGGAKQPRLHATPDATTATPSRRRTDEPSRWVELLDQLGDGLLGPDDPEVGAIVSMLADGLQAGGACLVRFEGHGDPTLAHISRTSTPLPPFEECREICTAVARAGRSANALTSFLIEGNPPLVVAAAAGPTLSPRALVVWGDFPHRAASPPLLRHMMRMLLHAQPERPSFTMTPPAQPPARLVFPEGHVPTCSEAMRTVYLQMEALLQGDLPVVITGETGVGKEHLARGLHLSSVRGRGPFQVVNCAAIPAELLEAELFGIEKGVATGVEARVGKFELANGGIVFLDEIGEMPLPLQAKMLRVLQSQEVQPVGAKASRAFDCRVVAATNGDLLRLVEQGRFRADLYYRIAGYVLVIPPLRSRREDIAEFVEHFLRRAASEVSKSVRGLSVRALRALVDAPWPGNIRQLALEVRRLVYMCPPGQSIDSALLSPELRAPHPALSANGLDLGAELRLDDRVADLERQLIVLALSRTRGNKAKAARLLGISRNGLLLKLERLRIE